MAVVLVGILVVPLATGFSGVVKQARELRESGGASPSSAGGEEIARISAAWAWGPRVVSAWWLPGPVLHVRAAAAPDAGEASAFLGLWADGWLLGEYPLRTGDPEAGTGGSIHVDPPMWGPLTGSELVLRVRVNDGAWGPPWRLSVPGPGGGAPPAGAPLDGDAHGPSTAVHRPAAGLSALTASWNPGTLPSPPFALLFVLDPVVHGWGGATLGEQAQWWWMEEGRGVDLYF